MGKLNRSIVLVRNRLQRVPVSTELADKPEANDCESKVISISVLEGVVTILLHINSEC